MAVRLARAASSLPQGISFLGIEAYRPPSLQRLFYDGYASRLRRERPGLPEVELAELVSRFVSPPATAPHPTGAAIDLTLADEHGTELDLGCPVDADPEISGGACYTAADGLAPAAASNRRILVAALTAVGMVNYPTEWWHWSFGDRYWAMAGGKSSAVYGPTAPRVA